MTQIGSGGNGTLNRLAYFSRFFQFGNNRRAYIVVGSLLLANGISHGLFAYHYFKDPEGFKESLSRLPKYFQPAATKSSDPATAMADDEQPAAITTTITQ